MRRNSQNNKQSTLGQTCLILHSIFWLLSKRNNRRESISWLKATPLPIAKAINQFLWHCSPHLKLKFIICLFRSPSINCQLNHSSVCPMQRNLPALFDWITHDSLGTRKSPVHNNSSQFRHQTLEFWNNAPAYFIIILWPSSAPPPTLPPTQPYILIDGIGQAHLHSS